MHLKCMYDLKSKCLIHMKMWKLHAIYFPLAVCKPSK